MSPHSVLEANLIELALIATYRLAVQAALRKELDRVQEERGALEAEVEQLRYWQFVARVVNPTVGEYCDQRMKAHEKDVGWQLKEAP